MKSSKWSIRTGVDILGLPDRIISMNKLYETLYTIDSTGKTRVWRQEQQGNKFRTISGVKDSDNLVTSEWTTCDGKNGGKANETSGSEQAEKEILAKYTKQLKTGYAKNEKDAAKGTAYVEPMLAKSLKDYTDKVDFNKQKWVLQCKFNGNRVLFTKDGAFTRKGEVYQTVPHINNALAHFFRNNPEAVLDGELYNYDLRQKLNELSKLIRRSVHITADDLRRSEQQVKFHCYDGYGFNDLDESVDYETRKNWIDKNVLGKVKYVNEVKSYPINCQEDLEKHYNSFIDDGEEGGILRKIDEGYEHKRSKFLLKVKPEMDSEAIILDVMEGDGNWSGVAKTATLKWKDKTFDATFKGSQEELRVVLKNKKDWINKEVTFLYNDVTGYGVPNFARIDILNCWKTDR